VNRLEETVCELRVQYYVQSESSCGIRIFYMKPCLSSHIMVFEFIQK
jgi:hypothetical protein